MEVAEDKPNYSSELRPLPLSELFLWGRVLRSHGLRGHVIVETFSEQPEAYDCSVFWVAFAHQSQAVPHRVVFREAHTSSARKNQGRSSKWRLRFQGCVDREAADALVRAELYLPRSFLPPLSPGQFYYVEAEGARVIDEQGVERGFLRHIHIGAAYDFFIVENDRGETFWIPAPFVEGLDRATIPPTLRVAAPDGLWDPRLAKGLP